MKTDQHNEPYNKVLKSFDYKGNVIKVVEREEPYMNASVIIRRVIAPNGGIIPVKTVRGDSVKSVIEKTNGLLDPYGDKRN